MSQLADDILIRKYPFEGLGFRLRNRRSPLDADHMLALHVIACSANGWGHISQPATVAYDEFVCRLCRFNNRTESDVTAPLYVGRYSVAELKFVRSGPEYFSPPPAEMKPCW